MISLMIMSENAWQILMANIQNVKLEDKANIKVIGSKRLYQIKIKNHLPISREQDYTH